MDEKLEEFLNYLEAVKRASPQTLRAYRADLKSFLCLSGKSPFSKTSLRVYLQSLQEKGQKASSIARKISSVKSFTRFAKKQGWIQENPFLDVKNISKEKILPKAVSFEEVLLLFSKPDIASYLGLRDRTIMELLYSSALRISELANLRKEDIRFEKKQVLVHGKGGKKRLLPITDTAVFWLKKYLDSKKRGQNTKEHKKEKDQKAVFLNRWGEKIHVRSINRAFQKYLQRTGLSEWITPHTIRHTIATHWLENGMNIKTIQLLLGHSSLRATTIYTKVAKKLKKSVYDQSHPRAGVKKEKR